MVAALLLAGCQGEDPGPIPTATLPTPSSPSLPTPSESSVDPIQTDIDAAVKIYSEGRRVAEDMLVNKSDRDVSDALSPYFAKSYLNYWEAEFDEFRREKLTTKGIVRIEIIAATDYEESAEATQLSLLLCSDYSEVSTTEPDGDTVRRGFNYSYDEVVMRKTDSRSWRAESSDSEVLQRIEGSECEDVLE